jgi:hypothetical protein
MQSWRDPGDGSYRRKQELRRRARNEEASTNPDLVSQEKENSANIFTTLVGAVRGAPWVIVLVAFSIVIVTAIREYDYEMMTKQELTAFNEKVRADEEKIRADEENIQAHEQVINELKTKILELQHQIEAMRGSQK